MTSQLKVILGSQSPQRLQLLEQILPREHIVIRPPLNSDEVGFSDLSERSEISDRLREIARTKNSDVATQSQEVSDALILTADTVIIVQDGSRQVVLGKPDGKNWQQTVTNWFMNFYSERNHEVVTGVCLRKPDGTIHEFECSTTVRFKRVSPELLKWYLSTGEPLGKAGGYGIQSAGSLFVDSIQGSLSNVIGLPLEKLCEVFHLGGSYDRHN